MSSLWHISKKILDEDTPTLKELTEVLCIMFIVWVCVTAFRKQFAIHIANGGVSLMPVVQVSV
jgi:hypothetical protein